VFALHTWIPTGRVFELNRHYKEAGRLIVCFSTFLINLLFLHRDRDKEVKGPVWESSEYNLTVAGLQRVILQ
jgi:hypothetical protein